MGPAFSTLVGIVTSSTAATFEFVTMTAELTLADAAVQQTLMASAHSGETAEERRTAVQELGRLQDQRAVQTTWSKVAIVSLQGMGFVAVTAAMALAT